MKKQSHLQNEIERLEKLVQHHEENGWFGTVFHEELARLKQQSNQGETAGQPDKEPLETGKGSATKDSKETK